jgi:hypothetical protein
MEIISAWGRIIQDIVVISVLLISTRELKKRLNFMKKFLLSVVAGCRRCFIFPKENKDFEEYTKQKRIQNLKLFSKWSLIINFTIYLEKSIRTDVWDTKSLAFNAINLLFSLGLHWLSERIYSLRSNMVLFFFACSQILFYLEGDYSMSKDEYAGAYLLTGAYFQFLQIGVIGCRISFPCYIPLVTSMSVYCQLRLERLMSQYFFSYFILALASNLAFCWRNEINEKNFFLLNKRQETTLMNWENILEDSFPAGILISQNNRIVFSNRTCNQILESNGLEENLLGALKNIELFSKNDLKRSGSIGTSDELRNSFHLGEIEDPLLNIYENIDSILDDKDGRLKSIKNFRSPSVRDILYKIPSCDSYYCSRKKEDGSLHYLEIKIFWVKWNDKPAKFLIISEDFLIDIILKNRNEIIYKDRLISTVSHDLRTPLNGINSLLDLSRERLQGLKEFETITMYTLILLIYSTHNLNILLKSLF